MLHTTSLQGVLVAASSTALAITLLAGCGQSDADVRAAHVKESAASVAKQAESYVGDPWERRAREEYLAKQQAASYVGDPWERRLREKYLAKQERHNSAKGCR